MLKKYRGYVKIKGKNEKRGALVMKNEIEIEKKFVIKMPDIHFLRGLPEYSESDIIQVYLKSPKGVTRRIRKRTFGKISVYTKTEKRRIDGMSAVEREEEIDSALFDELMNEKRENSHPVIKRRITFSFRDRLFEVDVYPEWEKSCIMEVELPSRDVTVEMPPFIELVRDVTGDGAYSNSAMSNSFPKEIV